MTIDDLACAARRPAPYEPGAELWNDPHIAGQMLKAHLASDTDAASYRPGRIDAICEYLIRAAGLRPGDAVVDLGCGPGLYCERLAAKGLAATGIDRSENSVRYALAHAAGNQTQYVRGSYLEPFGKDRFDAAIMISQDFGVLGPEDRRLLLGLIHRALRPGGCFVFDVPSLAAYRKRETESAARWYASDDGFWRPHRHFVLEDVVFYPEIPAQCDRYVVEDAAGVAIYRVWQTFFTPEALRQALTESGFWVETVSSGLGGGAYEESSPEIGVLCRKI